MGNEAKIKENRIRFLQEFAFAVGSLKFGDEYWAYNISTDSIHVARVIGKGSSCTEVQITYVNNGELTAITSTKIITDQQEWLMIPLDRLNVDIRLSSDQY